MKIILAVHAALLIVAIAFISSCGPALHQTKVPMWPGVGSVFVEKDFNEMYDYAMQTGLQLGYRVIHSNKDQGIISFTKEVGFDHVPVNINVQIVKVSEKEAYADITMQSPRPLTDLTLKEFRNAYISKWAQRPPTSSSQAKAPESKAGLALPPESPTPAPPVSSPPAPPTIQQTTHLITTKAANIRSEANLKSKIVKTLKKGQQIEKIGESGSWYNVKLASGDTGWVSKDLVKEVE